MQYPAVLRSIARYGLSAMVIGLLNAPIAMPTHAANLYDEGVQPASLPSTVKVDALLKPVGNTLFFTASDPQHGIELWKTDGTSAGTSLVKDINPGTASAFVPTAYSDAASTSSVVINNTLFFVASDGKTGYEVWKTNGTASGTVLLKDALPGPKPADFDEAPITNSLTNVDGTLYFTAVSSSTSRVLDLWKSDGTTSGTKRVKSIVPSHLKNVNGTLFFGRGRSEDEYGTIEQGELWKSSGSSSNTVLVKDLYPTPGGTLFDLTVVGKTLFFGSSDGNNALWVSDGTANGTIMLKETPDLITDLTSAGRLFFVVHSDQPALWTSDGTVKGTKMIKQVNASELKSVNGKLFFAAIDANNVTSLWTSDGTANGTVAIKTIDIGVTLGDFATVNRKLFFSVEGDTHHTAIWTSDGTTAGTRLLKDVKPGSVTYNALQLSAVQNTLFFRLDGQLWKSDGTSAGTVVVQ